MAERIKLLFVGNSLTYANDLPWLVDRLSESAPQTRLATSSESVTRDAASFESHWNGGEVERALSSRPADYVVFQEQSARPLEDPENTIEFGRRLGALALDRGAKPVFLVTWARRDHPQHQARLSRVFRVIADEMGGIVAPVGPAWADVHAQRPDLQLYLDDGLHPAPIGTYLAGCVICAGFLGAMVRKVAPTIVTTRYGTPEEGERELLPPLSEADSRYLQAISYRTVMECRAKST